MCDPQATRGWTLGRRFEPGADAAAFQDGSQVVCAGQLHADAAGRRQHRGLHLRRHAARANARTRAGHEHTHEVVRAGDAFDQLRTRMIRRSRIQAVNVRQQHEGIGLDHLGDERSKSIIVAETQLAGGHRVVLVEDWHDAEAEKPREGRAHVCVVVAAHHVVRGQQHLGGVEVMRLEGGGPPRHQESLAHRGGGLHARQVLRLG